MTHSPRDEISAMQAISTALESLDNNERRRVLNWTIDRFAIPVKGLAAEESTVEHEQSDAILEPPESTYSTFAELFAAISSACDKRVTNVVGALTAGYWLQIIQGQESFTSFSANKELKDAGHSVKNITDAFGRLQKQKPQLVVQVRKKGTSRQARKLYKLTVAGVNKIKRMLDGQDATR